MPISPTPTHGKLCADTMAALRVYFGEKDHRPSPEQWDALEDIAHTLDRMANGVCPSHVFLSSLDPGVGKTSAMASFARALLSSPDHDEVGMMVCVARIAEAESLAEALADQRHKITVWTTDDKANACGGCPPEHANHAQLLITTQQRIERATDGRRFQAVERFGYLGAPRQVRVWDEAWLPGRAIDLNEDDVAFLFKPIRRLSPEFHQGTQDILLRLGRRGDGGPDRRAGLGTALRGHAL